MNIDVFISYSSYDKAVADAACHIFESAGIHCWIAPRDIVPGSEWAESISNAIKGSKVLLLIFSEKSNVSNQVVKEVSLAVSSKLMICPLRISEISPSGALEYYLTDTHWLDCIDGNIEKSINHLCNVILLYLDNKDASFRDDKKPVKNKSRKILFTIGAIVALLLGITTTIVFMKLSQRHLSVTSTTGDVLVEHTDLVELVSNMTTIRSNQCVTETVLKKPLYSFSYRADSGNRIIALLNTNTEDEPGKLDTINPHLELCVLSSIAGCWQIDKKTNISLPIMTTIIGDDEGFIHWVFDATCSVFSIDQQLYICFIVHRDIIGNATPDTLDQCYAININTGVAYGITYANIISDVYSKNGQIVIDKDYPYGVEDYLISKISSGNIVYKAENDDIDYNDVKNYEKKWNLDNPNRLDIVESADYGENNKKFLKLTYYQKRPDESDYEEEKNTNYSSINNSEYTIYSRWRGNIYGYNKITKEYFPIWIDNYNYNDKELKFMDDDWLLITYKEFDNMPWIKFNLTTHEYYMGK